MEEVSALLILDLSQLRNITLNDEALMREVVDALVSDAAQRIEELKRAVERGDARACVKLAHNAQGACGNVGAVSMAALFCSLEMEAKDGDLGSCQSSLGTLSLELEKLRQQARSI